MFLNLLIDNAFLCVVAVGMTFVILSGGIDLSVGSVIALTTMVSAALVEKHGWSRRWRDPAGAGDGHAFGAFMGLLIERFRLQPFIVTLAGMFLARGPVLSDQHRLDQHRQRVLFGALADPRAGVGRCLDLAVGALIALARGGRSRSSSRTTRRSAAPCTPSAATSSRRC